MPTTSIKSWGQAFRPAAGLPPGARLASPRRGSALLAVLWLSAALAAIAFALATTVRGESERALTESDGVRAYYLAEGSVYRALLWMEWGPGYRRPDGSPMFYAPPMPLLHMRYPGGDAVVELIPATAKLDVNRASPEDLFRLLLAVGADPDRARQIASAIVDWRSGAPGLGMFEDFYASRKPSFRPPHASMQEIEELLLVRGMTPELFYGSYTRDANGKLVPRGGLRDCLSVYGTTDRFDVNTADPALLLSLGIPPEAVASIVARRRMRPFRSMGDLAYLSDTPGVARLGVGGNSIWTLRAAARLREPDGRLSDLARTVSATVKTLRQDQYDPPYHVLRWHDDAWSQSAVVPEDPVPVQPTKGTDLSK